VLLNQEGFGLTECHQVAGDGAPGAVGGAQVPLGGAEQRGSGRRSPMRCKMAH
jgi:hypothetical protein